MVSMEKYCTNDATYADEYLDSFTFTKEDLEQFDIDKTYIRVLNKLKQLKIARMKFINGYHLRLTQDYEPRLNFDMKSPKDVIGNLVENNLDSEQAYNEFNCELEKLYLVMSKPEIAYINDCLLCGKSDAYVRDKFNICRDNFYIIRSSAIIRFAITFNIVVYK